MNKQAYNRIIDTRAVLFIEHPFFATLLLHLKLRENYSLETMATDGIHLDYNPDFVIKEVDELELMSVLVHEGYHVAYRHHTRMGDRDLSKWNEACDYYINNDMIKMLFKMPPWMLKNPKYVGWSSEEIYDDIMQQKQQQQKQQQGGGSGQQQPQPGQGGQQPQPGGQKPDQQGQQPSGGSGQQPGDGSGGQPMPDPGRMGGIYPPAPQHESNVLASEDARWEAITRQAVSIAMGQNAGKIPGFLERLVTELEKSRVDWQTLFRNFVDDSMQKAYSWSRPNKRHLWRGIILPGLVTDSMHHLVVLADTSGSVNQKITNMYAAETTAFLDDGLADKVTVIYTDTIVQHVEEFERGDKVKLNPKGGGGTDFRAAFDYVVEHCGDASCIVFFTDAAATHYGEDPGIPVLWTVYGSKQMYQYYSKKIPFGTSMHIE